MVEKEDEALGMMVGCWWLVDNDMNVLVVVAVFRSVIVGLRGFCC